MTLSAQGQHTTSSTHARPINRLWVLVFGLVLAGCVEDGFSPDCPENEAYTDEDGAFDFEAWRAAAQAAGCVTPIGGPGGQSGGTP